MRQPSHFDYALCLAEMAEACLPVTTSSAAGEAASAHIMEVPVPIMKGVFNHLGYVVKIVSEKLLINHCAQACHSSAKSPIKVHNGRVLMNNALNAKQNAYGLINNHILLATLFKCII